VILAALLIISFVINCLTLGKPLREKKKKAVVAAGKERRIYGQLAEERSVTD
jgi:hypothetical protein